MPTEEEFIEEAKELGWTVEYLKAHYKKEERMSKMFEEMGNEM